MKSFRQYLIPSIVAQILMSAYAIVDGIFIGYRLNDAGLAAINLAWPITAFLQGLGLAFGISGGIYLTRLKAMGNEEKMKRVKGTILICLLCMAILLGGVFYLLRRPLLALYQAKGDTLNMAVDYISIILYGSIFQMMGCAMLPLLKNSGRVKTAMAASITATVSNLILDYFLIFLFQRGLKGAALASVMAQAISFLVCFIPYIKEIKGVCFDKETLKELFLGTPAPFILNYSYSILIIITNILCEIYGGDAAVAAYTVLSYMLWVVNAAAQGSGDSIQPLFSYHAERREHERNYQYLLKCILVSLGVILVFSIIFYVLRNPIGYLYGLSEDAMQMFSNALLFYLIGFIFIAVHKVICSYLYSVNRKLYANILVLLEPLVLTPLGYLLFVKLFHITGLWACFMVVQAVMLGLSLLFYFSSRRYDHERINHCG